LSVQRFKIPELSDFLRSDRLKNLGCFSQSTVIENVKNNHKLVFAKN